MNIGFICGEYPPCNNGGIGTFTKELAEELSKKGHNIVVFGIYYKAYLDIKKVVKEKINGVNIIRIPSSNYTKISIINHLIDRINFYFFTKKIISKYKLDLIEAPDSTGISIFKFKIPFITRLHGSVKYFGEEQNIKYSRLLSYFEKVQLNKSNLIIGVSNYVLKKTINYFNLNKKTSTVIHNSVKNFQIIEGKSKSKSKSYILYFGTIHPKKGITNLIKAFNVIAESNDDIKLILIGKSINYNGKDYREYLKEIIDDSNKNQIEFVSHVDKNNLVESILNSKFCIFPSFIECFSLAPMEAMSLGKPVIYSSLHSGKELINNGKDGLLVDPNNIDDIKEKILILLNNKELREKLAINGQNTIKTKFNFKNWIKQNESTYKKLINK